MPSVFLGANFWNITAHVGGFAFISSIFSSLWHVNIVLGFHREMKLLEESEEFKEPFQNRNNFLRNLADYP